MGIYISIEGYKYEGEFKNGLREGKGKIKYKNNDKYDGMWKNDKYNGKGIYYFHDGSIYDGIIKIILKMDMVNFFTKMEIDMKVNILTINKKA